MSSLPAAAARSFRVMLFGSDTVALATAKALYAQTQLRAGAAGLVSHLEVVTPPDKRHGRGRRMQPQFLKAAVRSLDASLVVHQTPDDCGIRLKDWELPMPSVRPSPCADDALLADTTAVEGGGGAPFDIGVVVSFGYFLPPRIIAQFRLGMINVHPSLLPRYRGAAPIQHALLNGDTHTGVSIIRVARQVDAGAVLAQRRVRIAPDATFASLSDELAALGADMVVDTLRSIAAGSDVATAQEDLAAAAAGAGAAAAGAAAATGDAAADEAEVPTAPKLPASVGRLDWTQPAADVYRRWQAVTGWVGASAHSFVAEADAIAAAEAEPAADGAPLSPAAVAALPGALRMRIAQFALPGSLRPDVAEFAANVSAAADAEAEGRAPPPPPQPHLRVGELAYGTRERVLWVGCDGAPGARARDALAITHAQLQDRKEQGATPVARRLRLLQRLHSKDKKAVAAPPPRLLLR